MNKGNDMEEYESRFKQIEDGLRELTHTVQNMNETRFNSLELDLKKLSVMVDEIRRKLLGDFNSEESMIQQHRYLIKKIATIDVDLKAVREKLLASQWIERGIGFMLALLVAAAVNWLFRKI